VESLDRAYGVLEASGPRRLAEAFLQEDEAVSRFFLEVSSSILSKGMFFQVVCGEVLKIMRERWLTRGRTQREVNRILDWLLVDEKMRFPNLFTAYAEALLQPFANSQRAPIPHKDRIKSYLLSHLGDPRFGHSAGQWKEVNPDCRRRFLSWLIEDTFQQFFRVFEATVKEESKHQLPARIRFWTEIYKSGKITDAYAAFGSKAAGHAERAFPDLAFGALRGNSSNSNSALLFEYCGRICVEFSNDGTFRWWSRNKGPSLHRSAYRANTDLNIDREGAKRHAGDWQTKIRAILRKIEREESYWGG